MFECKIRLPGQSDLLEVYTKTAAQGAQLIAELSKLAPAFKKPARKKPAPKKRRQKTKKGGAAGDVPAKAGASTSTLERRKKTPGPDDAAGEGEEEPDVAKKPAAKKPKKPNRPGGKRCVQCQHWGHTFGSCTNALACGICAESHATGKCPLLPLRISGENINSRRKCAICWKPGHSAPSRYCRGPPETPPERPPSQEEEPSAVTSPMDVAPAQEAQEACSQEACSLPQEARSKEVRTHSMLESSSLSPDHKRLHVSGNISSIAEDSLNSTLDVPRTPEYIPPQEACTKKPAPEESSISLRPPAFKPPRRSKPSDHFNETMDSFHEALERGKKMNATV